MSEKEKGAVTIHNLGDTTLYIGHARFDSYQTGVPVPPKDSLTVSTDPVEWCRQELLNRGMTTPFEFKDQTMQRHVYSVIGHYSGPVKYTFLAVDHGEAMQRAHSLHDGDKLEFKILDVEKLEVDLSSVKFVSK